MPRKIALAFLALALLLSLSPPVLAGQTAHIHFVVVAPKPAQGMSPIEAMAGFRAGLLKLAGGYTEWGPTQGASKHTGGVYRQNNFSYLVAADRDLTKELVALIKKYSDAKKPFVLHWTGTASIPLGQ
ncbi:MAG: hypothetical protein K9K66_07800 [Desulfarculaceae bacterium]|nr:hypothetical protein [Desulfarculaceae bacterium]MCF8072029.1 hypothetical protein [Desulfarculaceae bacterium]MCF8101546.1 hypothetical protein [Desulfarculaceae bacterium]MCF8115096.1 hypothetical protein [Desulfarculaceae bacterium]